MAALFGFVLLFFTYLISTFTKFIGFVLFIVYVGGIMILISYCVMLMPSRKLAKLPYIPAIIRLAFYGRDLIPISSFAYGLLYRARAIFFIAILLYLVIIAIVQIIDYSRGILKL